MEAPLLSSPTPPTSTSRDDNTIGRRNLPKLHDSAAEIGGDLSHRSSTCSAAITTASPTALHIRTRWWQQALLLIALGCCLVGLWHLAPAPEPRTEEELVRLGYRSEGNLLQRSWHKEGHHVIRSNQSSHRDLVPRLLR